MFIDKFVRRFLQKKESALLYGIPSGGVIYLVERWERSIVPAIKEMVGGLPEECMLAHAEVVPEILLPLISPRWPFKLAKPHPKLEAIAVRGVFWREIAGVKVVGASEADSSLTEATSLLRIGKYPGLLQEYFEPRLSNRLGYGSYHSLRLAAGRAICDVFELRGVAQAQNGGKFKPLFDGGSSVAEQVAFGALRTSLEYAIVFAILGDFQNDFGAFLRLWRIGNFPVAINRFSELVVVCDK